jgi:hypothetical protein
VPSQLHEALLALFRNQPALAPELLRDALRLELPAYTETRIESADLTDIQPAEYRADLVLALRDDRPALGIVVEVQLATDDRKRYAWPVYVAGLRARLQCPVCLLVVTPHEAVARWARRDIDLGGGSRLKPHVLSPSCVPEIIDEVRAKSDPELAVLSAMAHGRDRDALKAARIADVALAAARNLDDERKALYFDWVLKALSEAAGRKVQTMESFKFELQSDFARKYFAQGVTEGRSAVLLKQLQLKFGPLPESAINRVKSASMAELDAWTERVLSAGSLDEIVG